MTTAAKKFILLTYGLFWAFILLIGLIMVLTGSPQPSNLLQIIAAWAPTFVVLLFWKRLRPGSSVKQFVFDNFKTPLNGKTLSLLISVQAVIFVCSILLSTVLLKKPINELVILTPGFLLFSMFDHVVRGPIGEELGWRGFLLGELEKNFSSLYASIILGIVWAFWHLPLWLISGYSGVELFEYMLFFIIWCIAMSIIITRLCKWNPTILIPMLFHFFSNYFFGLQTSEVLFLLKISTPLYVIAAIIFGISLYRKEAADKI